MLQQTRKNCVPYPNTEEFSKTIIDQNQSEHFECRICLEQTNYQDNKILSPCSCIGSVKYVHEKCLKQWIGKMIEGSKQKIDTGKAHISCQLCSQKIHFNTDTSIGCNSFEKIKESIKNRQKTLIILIILMLTCMGFFSALLDYLIRLGWTALEGKNAFLVILMISAEVTIVLVICTIVGIILKQHFFSITVQISEIRKPEQISYKSMLKNKKSLIHPKITKN